MDAVTTNDEPLTTIDASSQFNQDRQHVHTAASGVCEICTSDAEPRTPPRPTGSAGILPAADRFDRGAAKQRHVSPAILEQRIINLSAENTALLAENSVLKQRIAGFEHLAQTLSAEIDKRLATFNPATIDEPPTTNKAAA